MRKSAPLCLSVAFLALFLLLTGRLVQLMLYQGPALSAMAEQQYTRTLSYYQYSRGPIVDRQGRAITDQEENCAVVFPAMVLDASQTCSRLADILDLSEKQLQLRLLQDGDAPYILRTGLSARQAEALLAADLPGITALPLAARYPSPATLTHLIGSCAPAEDGYQGVSGLEQQYEKYLAHRQGRQLLAYVDAVGSLSSGELYLQEQEEAYSALQLSIDLDVQQTVEQVFRDLGYTGAAVILEPEGGDVLALVSAPAYDPYGWTEAEAGAYVNKALSGLAPASTFKIVLAAAALCEDAALPEGDPRLNVPESGEESQPADDSEIVEPTDSPADSEHAGLFYCSGSYALTDGHVVHCTYAEDGHGWLNLSDALSHSCNCYFVALGQTLGGEIITRYATLFGLEEQVLSGYEWVDDDEHLSFSSTVPAAVANASLGEQGVSVSPLQMARLMAVFANGGFLVTPRLVEQVSSNQGYPILICDSQAPTRVLPAGVAAELRDLLETAVQEGTGQNAQTQCCAVAGKTGTSESGGVWFVGYAPAEKPQWVISVYVEDGSAGSVEAAAVFRQTVERLCLLQSE